MLLLAGLLLFLFFLMSLVVLLLLLLLLLLLPLAASLFGDIWLDLEFGWVEELSDKCCSASIPVSVADPNFSVFISLLSE